MVSNFSLNFLQLSLEIPIFYSSKNPWIPRKKNPGSEASSPEALLSQLREAQAGRATRATQVNEKLGSVADGESGWGCPKSAGWGIFFMENG